MTKTTPKLKFRLEVWERAVVFQVLEMDERFRSGAGEPVKEYTCKNKLDIVSYSSPDITGATIYLRGEDTPDDFDVETITFDTREQAENYKQKVLSALTEWSENWEGFKEANNSTKKEENNIYTV